MTRTVLKCGLTVIHEYIPTFPSFSMSYTLKSGSRAEDRSTMGVHHFIEHMLFKGSDKYSLKDIAELSDRMGGSLNAFTGKEITQYFLKALDEQYDMAFDLLSDIILNSTFIEEEFVREKNVIIQELKESEDNPDIYSFELFYEKAYADNGLAWPIGGTEPVVAGFTRDSVYSLYKELYKPSNLILTVCGNIEYERVMQSAEKAFGHFGDAVPSELNYDKPLCSTGSFLKPNENIQQAYLLMGVPGIAAASEDKYGFMIMNDILGAGMSSRLFQRIREELGLAYTISTFPDSFYDTGLQILYAIVESENVERCVEEIMVEIAGLKRDGIDKQELERSKDHIKASILLGLESNSAKMRFFTNQELYHEKSQGIQALIDEINGITVNNVNQIADKYLDTEKMIRFCYGECSKIGKF